MPYTAKDVPRFTKAAKTAKQKATWLKVYNSVVATGKSHSAAIRIANAAIKKVKKS